MLKNKNQSGQGTTEYVLLIAALAGIIFSLGIAFQNKLRKVMEKKVGKILERQISPDSVHRFRFIPK